MSFVYDRWLFGPISLLGGGGGGGGEIEWVPPNPVSPISNTIKKRCLFETGNAFVGKEGMFRDIAK